MQLRPYQEKIIDDVRSAFSGGANRVVVYMPTGVGKTVVASRIINLAIQKGSCVLFMAHRQELVRQASSHVRKYGLPHGTIMAGCPEDRSKKLQIASIGTLARREFPDSDLSFFDEVHHCVSRQWRDLAEKSRKVIGLTATPRRLDGRGLGDIFCTMVKSPSIAWFVQKGYLVKPRIFAPFVPDFSKFQLQGGDFSRSQTSSQMSEPDIVGDVVKQWLKTANGLQTICFACNIDHSKKICEAFRAQGVSAEHVDGNTPKDERDKITGRFACKLFQILCNVEVFTEGFDCPEVGCIIMARPTASEALYLQMAGRALRKADGKNECIIMDHAGNAVNHGHILEDRKWELDKTPPKKKELGETFPIKICPQCWAVYRPHVMVCSQCGHDFEAKQREIIASQEELHELTLEKAGQIKREENRLYACFHIQKKDGKKRDAYKTLLLIQKLRGHKGKWADCRFFATFNHCPPRR